MLKHHQLYKPEDKPWKLETKSRNKHWKRKNRENYLKGERHYLHHDLGLEIEEIGEESSGQFRYSNGKLRIDIYPAGKRYHNLQIQKRGDYEDLEELLTEVFQKHKSPHMIDY